MNNPASPRAPSAVLRAPLAWPASLPECPDGWAEQAEPVTVRTNVEEGPSKVRRRFTLRVVRVQVAMTLRIEQRNTLDDFFYVTLDGGVYSFQFRHPWLNAMKTWRMTEAPQFSDQGPMAVSVAMVWELMN